MDKEKNVPNFYTESNKDDIPAAIDGLNKFTHNFCMNCKETEEKGDLVFRCKSCEFSHGGKCLIKSFAFRHSRNGENLPEDFGSMCKL